MRARGSLDLLGPSTNRLSTRSRPGPASRTRAGSAPPTAPRCGSRRWRRDPVRRPWPAGGSRRGGQPGDAQHRESRWPARLPWRRAVSAGIEGATVPEAVRSAADAAAAAQRGHWAAGADVGRGSPGRPGWSPGSAWRGHGRRVPAGGTSLATQESVPAAFAVATASPEDPWLACRMAASLGGDCDTIAAMTGAICGACHGVEAFPGACGPRSPR